MKALIKVGYGCNDHCSFCHTLDVRHIDGPSEEVHRKIERAKRLGHSMVVLSGGEPTIRPELLRWAKHVASLGMDFGLVTNGRLLSYEKVVEQLLGFRLKYVYLSLHGGSAKVHNLMVRSEAFDETYGALRNLTGKGIDLTCNCVITRHNVDHLRAVVDAMLPYPDATLKFSMVEPKGGGDALFDHLMPRIAHVAERVRDALEHGDARVRESGATGPRFEHGAIPFCLLPGHEHRYSDLKTHRFWTMIEVGEADFFPVDDLNKVQPEETCRGCPLSGPCPGLYKGYHASFGASELQQPTAPRPRSNSFNYVYEARLAKEVNGTCPLREDGVTPWDRGRHLFVKHGSRLARFVAHGRDFSDAEIAETKHGLGQIYLDVSSKNAPDDFARDLRKLERSAMCTGCPEHDCCTGVFEPAEGEPFARDDARVRELVASLSGDVLDVGAGHGPYEDVLAARASAGALRYVALEPDAARAAQLIERWPWASVRAEPAEAIADAAAFDHVVVLRSWNHIGDPDTAIAAIARALRPKGTLTVVDNTAFGLARTAAQAARAESSDAALEHYRNDTAEDAHRRIAAAGGLDLLERADVGPRTSNQWLLRYERAAD